MTKHNDSTSRDPRAEAHAALDTALLDLRRLWIHPRLLRWFSDQLGVDVELGLLRTLRAVEISGGTSGVGDVASVLVVDASTASRLVEQAVVEGYLVRRSCPQDRRRSALSLAPEGHELLKRAAQARNELLGRATQQWSDDELERAAVTFTRLREDLRTLLEGEEHN